MSNATAVNEKTFIGFVAPEQNYYKTPNSFTDICADIDNLAELKCVIYILRHTWGYQEFGVKKAITTDEFMYGRIYRHGEREGQRMDTGTGLSNKSVVDGLARAVEHGYIEVGVDATDKGRIRKAYTIRMQQSHPYVDPTQGEKPEVPENTYVDPTQQVCRSYTAGMYDLHSNCVDPTHRSLERNKRKKQEKEKGKESVLSDAENTPPSLFPDLLPTTPEIPIVEKSVQWNATSCKTMFDEWRGFPLASVRVAKEKAKYLADNFSREVVIAAHDYMSTDPWWKDHVGGDIAVVAKHMPTVMTQLGIIDPKGTGLNILKFPQGQSKSSAESLVSSEPKKPVMSQQQKELREMQARFRNKPPTTLLQKIGR